MSKIERTKCDHCGKEVIDPYAETGWIYLSKDGLAVRMGRVDGAPKAFHPRGSDFCGLACLVKALDDQREAFLAEESTRRLREPILPYTTDLKGTRALQEALDAVKMPLGFAEMYDTAKMKIT